MSQVQVFIHGWTTQGKGSVEKLRSSTFYPKQVCPLIAPLVCWSMYVVGGGELETEFDHGTIRENQAETA